MCEVVAVSLDSCCMSPNAGLPLPKEGPLSTATKNQVSFLLVKGTSCRITACQLFTQH